jgi:hypothetical protein
MYRLYIDEVGADGLTNLDKDKHRYLSLTGIAMRVEHARDYLEPTLNKIKAEIFDHDPDSPLILHRKEIMGFKGPYQRLRDKDVCAAFDKAILATFEGADYAVITALIDKAWMLKQYHWANRHPYHYLMEIVVEKYVQFLERRHDIGDLMPESRQDKDVLLQSAYNGVRAKGTSFVNPQRIASALRGDKLKFRRKEHNVAGLQLCDLLAHPSHMYTRYLMRHEVNLGQFSTKVCGILIDTKYDRSPWNGKIVGYGIKHLPQ